MNVVCMTVRRQALLLDLAKHRLSEPSPVYLYQSSLLHLAQNTHNQPDSAVHCGRPSGRHPASADPGNKIIASPL